MAYSLSISLALGSGQTGLTLSAQLVDTVGTNIGSAVTTDFIEIGLGNYLWTYASFPDSFRGGVKFTASSVLKAFVAINPEEAEFTNAKVTTRAIPGDSMNLTSGERDTVVDLMWNEAIAGHLTSGTTGKALDDAKDAADAGSIADAVWDEARAGHIISGSFGEGVAVHPTGLNSVLAPADVVDNADARTTFMKMFRAVFNRFYNRVEQTSTQQLVFDDASAQAKMVMGVTTTGATQVKGKSA